ncbi:MAG TPA: type 4a pilus biogenesis protein PilO [bacterium]|jgi:Tfp pilus assembly protein PilO|nr:type 4a pilus biogenesis protein PilO [bacterium]
MNQKYWIVIGGLALGLALLTFAGWRFLVHPLSADYAAAVAQKAVIDAQLQTARDTAAQFSKFRAQEEDMRRDLEFYSSRTDGRLNAVEVSQMLTTLGKGLGLGNWLITVAKQPSIGGIGQYAVQLSFKSDFERLGGFLNACVSQRRIIVPTGITINSVDDPNGVYNDTMTVSLNMTVYGGLDAKAGGRI